MTEPITVRFYLSAGDFFTGALWNFRRNVKPVFRLLMMIVVVVAIVRDATVNPLMAGFLFLISVLAGAVCWAVIAAQTRRNIKTAESTWIIGAESVKLQSKLSTEESQRERFREIVETPKGFLFDGGGKTVYWLPRRGFKDSEEFDQLSELARIRAVKYRKM